MTTVAVTRAKNYKKKGDREISQHARPNDVTKVGPDVSLIPALFDEELLRFELPKLFLDLRLLPRGHKESKPRWQISELLDEQAKQGRQVLRRELAQSVDDDDDGFFLRTTFYGIGRRSNQHLKDLIGLVGNIKRRPQIFRVLR